MILQNIISQSLIDIKISEPTLIIDNDVDTSLDDILHLVTYKSSDFPLFVTTKSYFTIYSTDHETLTGAKIMWGEMDNTEFDGFIERDEIIVFNNGYQQEAPYLLKIPTSKSGLVSDEYFLYYHTSSADPNNNAAQETHLVTTSGGFTPDLCTWTQRLDGNGDNVFHLEAGDDHTGYGRGIETLDGGYVMTHSVQGGAVNRYAFSSSINGIDWVRVSTVDTNEIIPDNSGRTIQNASNISLFYYQNILYGLFRSDFNICICRCSPTTFKPIQFIKDIFNLKKEGLSTYWKYNLYIENSIMYISIREQTTSRNWYIITTPLEIIDN